MAYLGSWKIGDYLTFACNTHAVAGGAATDADSVPTYRVYEDETGSAIATGSMAKLDDANTIGFYSERIQLLAATGFEKGKCYTIYVSATIDSTTATMHHTFQIEAEVDANRLSTAPSITVASPVADDQDITLYPSDDYDGDRILTMIVTDYSGYDLDSATAKFRLLERGEYESGATTTADLEKDATISVDGSTVTITVDLAPTDMASLETRPDGQTDNYRYQVVVTTSGSKKVTLLDGNATIAKSIASSS